MKNSYFTLTKFYNFYCFTVFLDQINADFSFLNCTLLLFSFVVKNRSPKACYHFLFSVVS